MKVFVAKTLVESIDLNSCSVEVFDSLEKAQKYSKAEIASYAEEYEGEVIEECPTYFAMQSGDQYVTIEIVEKEII